ncbi:MAG TPA: hypothetical protein VL588_04340 [Bdellovibrionota bacterium]|nr:hypothetical protein [Bdellovibrionota bacterium]
MFHLGLLAVGIVSAFLAGALSFPDLDGVSASRIVAQTVSVPVLGQPGTLIQEALMMATLQRAFATPSSQRLPQDRLRALASSLESAALWAEHRGVNEGRPLEGGHARNLLLNTRDKILLAASALPCITHKMSDDATERASEDRMIEHEVAMITAPPASPSSGRLPASREGDGISPAQREEMIVDQMVRWLSRDPENSMVPARDRRF